MSDPAILFVCLGNICRSPMAEGAMADAMRVHNLAWQIDSCGTGGWHTGDAPDPRAIAEAARNGVDIAALRARQLEDADYRRFTHIVCMDADNLAQVTMRAPKDATASASLLLDWLDPAGGRSVADPYYGGDDGFAQTWRDVREGTRAIIDKLR